MDPFVNMEPASADKTMALLWSQVRQRGDLPGFSRVVKAILTAMRDDEREFNMTRTVLQDPALTQKVLRLANSAMYSVFGQGINTVSKAVIILGTEAIGHLALGLKLIDSLSDASADSVNARAEMEKAVLAGHIARQVASSASTRDAEEAVVCSMLHSLGRMMVTFYLPERWLQAMEYRAETGVDEKEAARKVLGLGLDEVGRAVACEWSFPSSLVDTLKDVQPRPVDEPLDHQDWLAAVSSLCSQCADAICDHGAHAEAELSRLASAYSEMLGMEASQVIAAVDTAQRVAVEENAESVRPVRRSDPVTATSTALAGKPVDAALILARGVTDMRSAMENASNGQLMSMALETIFQGLGLSRAIAFLRNPEASRYSAQMCLGEGVQELLPRLAFGDAYQPDVFHAALANDKMIFVENAQAAAFVNKLPRWWKDALPTVRSFTVLPLTINRNPVGFLYGDWDSVKPATRIEQAEVAPLNELRNLIMQVLEKRRLADPSWMRRLR